jgi:hypothetical protein
MTKASKKCPFNLDGVVGKRRKRKRRKAKVRKINVEISDSNRVLCVLRTSITTAVNDFENGGLRWYTM